MRSADPRLKVEGFTRGAEKLEFSLYSVELLTTDCKNRDDSVLRSSGDHSGGETPGPIPNPAVKPASADGTWGAAPWESRTLPEDLFVAQPPHRSTGGLAQKIDL